MPPSEHAAQLAAATGVCLSPSHLSRLLAKRDLWLKKEAIAVERDEVARAAWRAAMAEVDPARLVFLDETSTLMTFTPLRGGRHAGSGRTARRRADGGRRFPG